VGPPPQRDVGRGKKRHPEADVARRAGPGLASDPPRPGGEEAAGQCDDARQEREGDDEVDGQDQQVLGLGKEPPVESRRREGGRHPEEDAADEADARRGPQRSAQRCGPAGATEDEAVERAVEIAEAPQLLAHRVDGGERRPVAAHQGRQRPLKR
jgi:hypothetical protein